MCHYIQLANKPGEKVDRFCDDVTGVCTHLSHCWCRSARPPRARWSSPACQARAPAGPWWRAPPWWPRPSPSQGHCWDSGPDPARCTAAG